MTEEGKLDKVWKKFLRKHWQFTLIVVAGIALAVIGAILVFLWRVDAAQASGMVPGFIASWSVGNIVRFCLSILFWELIVIGIPVLAAVGVGYLLWWKKLPDDEQEEYKRDPKKKRARNGGGAISFLVTITWLIVVYAKGMWNVPFSNVQWSFNFLINSWLTALLWDLLIFGIPIAIALIFWLRHEMKEES